MADEEFQVIITNDDYDKLRAHQKENEELANRLKQQKD